MAGTVVWVFLAAFSISEAVYYCPVPETSFKTDLSRKEYEHGFPVGVKLYFYCSDGFKLRGRKVSQCLADGWSPDPPKCISEETTCERRKQPKNGMISPSKEIFSAGDEITYFCNDGYELVGEKTDTCLQDGKWELKKMPACFSVMCRKIKTPSDVHADSSYGSYFPGEEVKFSCEEGYKLDGNRRNKCENDGKWKYDTELKCVKFGSCRKRRSPRNGDQSPELPEYFPGNTITFTCESGYYLDGLFYNECLETGEWRFDTTPDCKRATCSRDDLSAFTELEPDFQSYRPGEVVEVSCGDGYKLIGDAKVVCQENRKWSNLPKCKKITTCPKRRPPTKGFNSPEQSEYHPEDTILYICQDGYFLDGLVYNECLINGKWRFEITPDCKKITCRSEELSGYSKIDPDFRNYEPGEKVEVFCEDGYETIGDNEVVCQKNGKWSSLPKCKKVKCLMPSAPANGYVSHFLGYKLPGERIEYRCLIGYKLIGSDNNVCTGTGEWKYKSPVCKEKESCSHRGPPRHGKVSAKEGPHYVGERISYSCDEGYYLDGDKENLCQDGGEWQFARAPRCRKYCFFKKFELDENLIPSRKQRLYENGDEVRFTCKSSLAVDGANLLRCEDGGRWSERAPTCVNVCSKPVVEHGAVEDSDVKREFYRVGDNVRFVCDEDYQLEDARTGKCLSDGSWSREALCKLKQQCIGKEVANGGVRPDNKKYNIGDKVRYFCLSGYILTSTVSSNECTSDGSWKFPVPDCKESNQNTNCRRRCNVRTDYRRFPCQCNLSCRWFKNCCNDYREECTSSEE